MSHRVATSFRLNGKRSADCWPITYRRRDLVVGKEVNYRQYDNNCKHCMIHEYKIVKVSKIYNTFKSAFCKPILLYYHS